MKTKNKYLNAPLVLVVLAALISFTGCGARKTTSGSTEESSRIPDAGTTTKAVVQCNRALGNFVDAEIRPYVDAFGKSLVDKVRVNITTASALEATGSSLVLYRWMASYPENIFLDQTPLELWLEPRAGGAPITGILKKINWDEIDDILTQKGVALSKMQDVFDRYSFVVNLRDLDATYDAMSFSLYQNGSLASKLDALIPIFHANPNDYATDTRKGEIRPTVLQNLHPFKNYITSSISNEDYSGMASSLCSTLQ